MMKHDDAERAFAVKLLQHLAETGELIAMQPAGRGERQRRQRRRKPDQRQRTASPHKRKILAGIARM